MKSMDALTLANWLADEARANPILLDVREFSEIQRCQISGSLHIAMQSIPARLNELNREAPIVCICHHGVRSMRVVHFLEQQGFTKVHNLTGGINEWANQIDHTMEKY